MDALKEWFTAITGIVILSAIGEGGLPSGNIKKYVRILFGIILIIAVCMPFVKGDKDTFKINVESIEAYVEAENLEEKEREMVLRLYKANLEKQLIASLKGVCDNCEIEVETDIETQNIDEFGKIRGVIVIVKTNDEELYLNDKIEEIISQTYGVSKKNIAIKYSK